MAKKKQKVTLRYQIGMFKKCFAFAGENKKKFVFCLLLLSPIEFIVSYLFSKGFGYLISAVTGLNAQEYIIGLMLVCSVIAVRFLVIPISNRFSMLSMNIIKSVRVKFFNHVQNLPVKTFDDTHSGEFLTRLGDDVGMLSHVFSRSFSELTMSAVTVLGGSILILSKAPLLFAATVVIGAYQIFFHAYFAKLNRVWIKKAKSHRTAANRLFLDILSGQWVVRMFNLGDWMLSRYDDAITSERDAYMKKGTINTFNFGLYSFVDALSISGITILSIFLVQNGTIELVDMMLVSNMANSVISNIGRYGEVLVRFQEALVSAERVFEVLDIKTEREGSSEGSINDESVALSVKDLEFSYNSDRQIIKNLSFTVKRGETLAVVGGSGGGKSTLFKLLLGFYPLNSGTIEVFGKDIEAYSLGELRAQFAYVPQSNFLFSGTIMENLRFGNDGAADEQIVEAAKLANAHEFITEFAKGYDTEVGERGNNLSGGQRQRIAIARALLKDAPILLLDEATASLDSKSELEVQSAIENIMRGRTTVVVAHRLSTIENADHIVVVEDGKIVERGTHETLLKLNKRYAYYYGLGFNAIAD